MSLMWLVSRHVDRQKRELLQYLLDNDAVDAEHAIDLSDIAVKPSYPEVDDLAEHREASSIRQLLRRSITVHDAYGASNGFILYAIGAFLLAFVVIMLW